MTQGNWAFIAAAYGAAWLAVGGYWLFVHRVLRAARVRYEQSQAAPVQGGRGAR